MRKKTFVFLALLAAALLCSGAHAQTQPPYGYSSPDPYGGNPALPCTWPPPSKTAITGIVLSSGTVTVTVASTANFNPTLTQNAYVTGVTDSFYNTPLTGAGVKVTNASGTTLTYAGSGSHAASSGGFIVPANWYIQYNGASTPLCTPTGNHLFYEALTLFVPASLSSRSAVTRAIFASKFGSSLPASVQATYNTIFTRNFNALGDNSSGQWSPSGGNCSGSCFPIPQIDADFADAYSTNQPFFATIGTEPVLDIMQAHDSNWSATTGNDMVDVFNPAFSSFLQGYYKCVSCSGFTPLIKTPYEAVIYEGGIDQRSLGTGAGPDFDTFVVGQNDNDDALQVLITSPLQTYTPSTLYRGAKIVYADPLNYTKTPQVSPPATCGFTHATECSLASFLTKKYGTIGALNTAWGTSYTTLGSSGICVGYAYPWCGSTTTIETYGTTTNANLGPYTHTLANTRVDPNSIQVFLGGVLVAGDCPTGRSGCPTVSNFTSFKGNGSFGGITAGGCGTGIGGGGCSITFGSNPGNQTITIAYEANGWGSGLGTGLMDEDGATVPWGASKNTKCLLSVAASPTPGSQSYACRPGNPGGLPAVNWNQNAAADLIAWDTELVAQSMDTIQTNFKASCPSCLMGSAQFMGNWHATAPSWYLAGASPYVDVIWTNMIFNVPSQSVGNAMINYVTKATSKPLFNEVYPTACPDSATAGVSTFSAGPPVTCNSAPAETTQPLRAAFYQNLVQSELGSAANSFTGLQQFMGQSWWGGLHDCDSVDSPANNWGTMSCSDNLYNAAEAATAVVACSAPNAAFNCGSESAPGGSAVRPFGDLFGGPNGVTATNALWFAPSGVVSISPTSFSFGSVTVGVTSSPMTATLTNGSGSTITFTGNTLTTGTNFAIIGSSCTGTLVNGGTCTISVTFTPLSTGALSDTLNVAFTGASGSPVTVALSGTGTPAGSVTVAPTSFSFGSVTVGVTSSPMTATLTNGTSSTITLTGNTLTTGTQFAIVPGSSCTGTLAAGGTCTISATFTPLSAGAQSDTLNVAYTGTSGSPATIALSGTGVAATNNGPTSFPVNWNAVPLPATPPTPTLTQSTPSQSYVTSAGFSQDGKTFVNPLVIKFLGANFVAGPTATFDGKAVTATLISSTEVDVSVPLTMVSLPGASAVEHAIVLTLPAPAAPPVLQ